MTEQDVRKRLNKLYNKSKPLTINRASKLVIFSDLHMGNGGKRDDFLDNGNMMHSILQDFYYEGKYTLILNGDIDELLRFSQSSIKKKWHRLYRLFNKFHIADRLFKLFGNHDYELHNQSKVGEGGLPIREAVTLRHQSGDLLVVHGHQAGRLCSDFLNQITAFILKYLATPLGIKNYSVAHDSRTRFKIEKRVYDFARSRKIIAIIGHTHRPLFESLSKVDNLKYKIEDLCRKYPPSSQIERQKLELRIKKYKKELLSLVKSRNGNHSSLYQSEPLVPCIFNSGCCVGRSGMTALEICDNKIQLVYWFDEKKSRKYFDFNGYTPLQLPESNYYRVILKEEPLDYIFARIKLLA